MSKAVQAPTVEVRSPFPPQSYYTLYDWCLPFWKNIADDTTPKDREGFIQMQIEMAQSDYIKTWGVWRGSELGGFISVVIQPRREWIAQPHCIFKKSFWGANTTVAALRQVVSELFDSGILKIEMWVFENSHSVRGLIGQFGAKEEGRLTAQVIQDGEPITMIVFGLYPEGFLNSLEKE